MLQYVSGKCATIVEIGVFDLLGCTQNVLKYGVPCLQQVACKWLLRALYDIATIVATGARRVN